jgi:ferredoxin-NADP reductase
MRTRITLVRTEAIARDTTAFHFRRPAGFAFRAGQFADYTLIDPPETDSQGNTRGFSLANAPYEPDLIAATRIRDTAFKRVLSRLPVGTEVELDAPYGDFTLHRTPTTLAVFIIGGIGVTPVRSMIAQAMRDRTGHQITLLHASRTPEDLAYRSDFERLASGHRNFRYVPVATDSAPAAWRGERGRVDERMLARYVPKLTGPIFYLSGPEGMVKAMRRLLVGLRVDEDSMRTEEFAGY